MGVQRLSHVGICVSDLERSVAFYRDALGFAVLSEIEVGGPDAEQLLDLDPVALRATYLERDGTRIELLRFDEPGETGAPGPHPINRLGLTHLSFRVADLELVAAAVETAGGRILKTSRIDNSRFGMSAVFVTDPDGLRIELLQAKGDPDALPGG
jgi:catechol 2,3-dioxygenase-like lactoylglutathione lyase family enzyme